MRKWGMAIGSILTGLTMVLLLGKGSSKDYQVNPVETQAGEMCQNETDIENENTVEADKMDAYYGCYQITRFYPTIYYSDR